MNMDDSYSSDSSYSKTDGRGNRPVQSKSRVWVWLIIGLVLVFVFYLAFRKPTTNAGGEQKTSKKGFGGPVAINTATAKQGDIGVYLNAIGTVTPVYTSMITSQVSGLISSVHYREAQVVRKGDPLIDVDPRTYPAQLEQAEGTLEKDTHVLEQSRMDLNRYRQAWSRNAIAKQQVDDQEQTVLQYEGTVKNDQGQVENAKVNLIYCHITSPIDGRVGLRLVDPGNIVQANSATSLVVVTQLQPITVIFSVAEDYLPQIQAQLRKGQRMVVDAFDREQQKKLASGSLLTLDNQIDTTTGTLKLKAIFQNEDGSLFANQFVNARLLVDTTHDAILIPTAAIQRNAQGACLRH